MECKKNSPTSIQIGIKKNSEKTTNGENSVISIKGMFKLTLLPFSDHSATLAITFAIADKKYNILGLLFLQTYCESIDSEHSQLILNYNL